MIKNPIDTTLDNHLDYLKLPYLKENCRPFAAKGNSNHWTHLDYLARLIEGEAAARQTAPSFVASRMPVFRPSKHLIPSAGIGQRRSIGSRSRICSGCASSAMKI
jgi:hypothetical protein